MNFAVKLSVYIIWKSGLDIIIKEADKCSAVVVWDKTVGRRIITLTMWLFMRNFKKILQLSKVLDRV